MRQFSRYFVGPLLATVFLATGFEAAAETVPSADVPWGKLWNKAFAKDFKGKDVQFTAIWIGVAQSLMDVTAGQEPWNKMVEVGVAPVGAAKVMGFYADGKWALFVPKSLSDEAFGIAEGTKVRIYAKAGTFDLPGTGEVVALTVTKIERLANEVAAASPAVQTESGDKQVTVDPEAASDVPWGKLWNKAFAKDFKGKEVQFTAMWIGVAQSLMDVTAGQEPWSKMVEVGVAPVGAAKVMGFYADGKWAVFVPKSMSDEAFGIAEGTKVRIYAKAGTFDLPGTGEVLALTVIRIEQL